MMQTTSTRLAQVLATLWPDATLPAALTNEKRTLTLCRDSRAIAPGTEAVVFVAVPGVNVDGRNFIDQALMAGAALVLAEEQDPPARLPDDARVMALPALGRRLGELGGQLFAVPEELELIGVTGTNGKSSVTHYIAALGERLGRSTGLIGTLGWGRPGELIDSGLTTPGPLELQAALGAMAAAGLTRVAMEVSSHALEQERLTGCRVSVAAFTNLSRDHLDYHASMAAYAAAKARLFKRQELALAVVNGDDPLARLMLAGLPDGVRVLASGTQEATTFRVLDWQGGDAGLHALVATPDGERALELALVGRFNLDNVLLAMTVLYGLGEPIDALFEAAAALAPVPGRMQLVTRPGAPTVVIDYAHTPEALSNALEALQAHLSPADGAQAREARLWCLFGCGGDRDTGKRALMAEAAEARADQIVITDDNPRSESPRAIREQIAAGLTTEGRKRAWCIDGRAAAIEQAIAAAGGDDIILVAGKGHETYQDIGGKRMPFSDQAYVERALARREARR